MAWRRKEYYSEYLAWSNMKARCSNPRNPQFKDYGGRGISFDPAWETFEPFLADLGPKPLGNWLEREDNERGYSKDNCRWATTKEQLNNTRRNRLLTAQGETLTVAQWADKLGLRYSTLHGRIQAGWSLEDALAPCRYWPNQPRND